MLKGNVVSEQEKYTFGDALKNIKIEDLPIDLFKIDDKVQNYQNSSYKVVSIFGYLIGVDGSQFTNIDNPAMEEKIFNKLDINKNARIIRNLCLVRNSLEQRYLAIANTMRNEIKNIDMMPDLIDSKAVIQLHEDGVSIVKNHHDVDQYLIEINTQISNRINNIKSVFPEWIEFEYIKELFIMPNGFSKKGIKEAGEYYNSNRNRYPYQVYMNWCMEDVGNILYCDEKFVKLIYEYNEDFFGDLSLVRNAGDLSINNINSFIEESESVIFSVDCENSNPIALASVLGGLPNELKTKVKDVLLFDSRYTGQGWTIMSEGSEQQNLDDNFFDWNSLESTAGVKMTHIVVDRLLESKSQVDMTLAMQTTTQIYENNVDSVVLVSSDSDYWAMISNLPKVKFLVMMEHIKTSPTMTEKLDSKGIHYCFLDDFYTGVTYGIKTDSLKRYLQAYFDNKLSFDVDEVMAEAIRNSWLQMTPREIENFVNAYILKAHAEIKNGKFRLLLGEKK